MFYVLRVYLFVTHLLTLPRIFPCGTPALVLDAAFPTTVEVSHIAVEGKTVVARDVGCDFKSRVVSDKLTYTVEPLPHTDCQQQVASHRTLQIKLISNHLLDVRFHPFYVLFF
jgi:hypothetical protein